MTPFETPNSQLSLRRLHPQSSKGYLSSVFERPLLCVLFSSLPIGAVRLNHIQLFDTSRSFTTSSELTPFLDGDTKFFSFSSTIKTPVSNYVRHKREERVRDGVWDTQSISEVGGCECTGIDHGCACAFTMRVLRLKKRTNPLRHHIRFPHQN